MDSTVPLSTPGTRCDSCGQCPQDFDRDLLPEVSEYVAWARKGKDSSGRRVLAEGNECSMCQKVRVNRWVESTNADSCSYDKRTLNLVAFRGCGLEGEEGERREGIHRGRGRETERVETVRQRNDK